MYNASIQGKRFDQGTQTSILTVVFTGTAGEPEVSDQMKFSVDTSYDDILRAIKRKAESLAVRHTEDQKIPVGAVDLAAVTAVVVPVENDNFDKWSRQYGKLRTVQDLIALGVLTGTEQFVVDLRQKVATDFRPAFLKFL